MIKKQQSKLYKDTQLIKKSRWLKNEFKKSQCFNAL